MAPIARREHLLFTDNTQGALRLDEAARRLSISTQTLRRLIAKGEFPAVKVGRGIRVLPADLADYLTASRISADLDVHNDLDPAGGPGRGTTVSDHRHDRL